MTRDPFLCDGPTVVSFSGGRTSGLMLRRVLDAHGGVLPPDVHVVFTNTGKERLETLAFVAECATRWDVSIHWIERDAAVVERLPSKLSVPAMVEWLASRGVTLPEAFFNRNRDTVFPWAHVVTSGDDADKWKRYVGMQRKLASDRFKGGPLPQEFESVASEVA